MNRFSDLISQLRSDDDYLKYSFRWPKMFLHSWKIEPWKATLQVTRGCNHRCVSCTCTMKDPNELSTDEWKRVINELPAGERFECVNFTGGEPLLRKDFLELVETAKTRGFTRISLNSNATLISSTSTAEQLLTAGINAFTISYHGIGTHDQFTRRKSAEEKVCQGIDNIIAAAESMKEKEGSS